jgi:hypothetical protein
MEWIKCWVTVKDSVAKWYNFCFQIGSRIWQIKESTNFWNTAEMMNMLVAGMDPMAMMLKDLGIWLLHPCLILLGKKKCTEKCAFNCLIYLLGCRCWTKNLTAQFQCWTDHKYQEINSHHGITFVRAIKLWGKCSWEAFSTTLNSTRQN